MCECESEQNAPRILIFSSVGCRPAHLTRVRPPRCITLLRGDEQSAGPTGARVASKLGRVVSSKVTGRYLGRMDHRGERLGSQSWIPNHVLGDARQPRGEMKNCGGRSGHYAAAIDLYQIGILVHTDIRTPTCVGVLA